MKRCKIKIRTKQSGKNEKHSIIFIIAQLKIGGKNMNLDRFAQGLPDPQECEPELIGKCSCGCGEDILAGYEYIEAEGDWFADITCFLKHHGAEWRFAEGVN